MYKLKYRHKDEMKDSGIEWLGMIPKEWGCGRIQQFFNIRTEKVSDKDYEPLSVTKNGVLRQLENVAKTNNGDNRKKVKKNDFVINSRADRKGSCGVSPFDGSVSLICHVLTPKSGIVPEYINHLFRNYYFSEEFFRWGTGIVDDLWSTNIDRMKKITIPIPIEQEKIANFLDIKTAQFDSIISKKEKLIEKLEEAKKSLISEVVTGKVKIVDGQIVERKPEELKDSGVEWLGMIPKDWTKTKIKYNTYVKGRIGWQGLKSNEFIEKGPFLVTGTDFKDNEIDWKTCYHISNKRYEEAPAIHLKDGDLLITKDGSIGKLAIVNNCPDKAILNSGIFVTRCLGDEYLTKFLFYTLSSKIFENYISLTARGTTILHLYQETFINFIFVLPSICEQEIISNFLDNKTNHINNIITKTKLQIQKLKSAKQSLISEAVTGKIDLRDWEIVDERGENL